MTTTEPRSLQTTDELREAGLLAQLTPSGANAQGVRLPTQFHLSGEGVAVTYFPHGSGPLVLPGGAVVLVYQDSFRTHVFRANAVRTVQVPDLGTIVSVTLVLTIDTGSTTFSLVVPDMALPDESPRGIPVSTYGITTLHRLFVGAIGHPQHETYNAIPLRGTASAAPLPL